jgi:ribosomal protein L40E
MTYPIDFYEIEARRAAFEKELQAMLGDEARVSIHVQGFRDPRRARELAHNALRYAGFAAYRVKSRSHTFVSNFEVVGVNSSIDIAVSRRARSTESKSDWTCRICGARNEAEARTCRRCDQDAARERAEYMKGG